jgi:preprotein translocase subunit YajC
MEKRTILHSGSILGSLIALLIFIGSCVPESTTQTPQQDGMSNIYLIIFVILIIAVWYFTMMRPQRKQQKQRQEMMSQLRSGEKVVTMAGIFGEIVSVDDNSVVLKVESGATVRVTKSSVAGKIQK